MIPILYRQSETNFTSGGICRLVDCVECTVTEERNGIYELEFVYPITGRNYDLIEEGLVVACTHDNSGDVEPFDIYGRSAPIDGLVTFYASHISYRLSNYILTPFSGEGIQSVLSKIRGHCLSWCPFTFWTNKASEGGYVLDLPRSVKDTLGGSEGSILDNYGSGEYEFNKFAVKLWQNRGADNGVEIRYGKNLLDITDETNYSDVYNAIIPYWHSAETGQLVTLPEWFISVPGAYLHNEPWTDNFGNVMTNEDGVELDFDYSVLSVRMVDYTADFQFKPTPDDLRAHAIAKFGDSGAWLADRTIDVDFVQLWQTADYKDIAPLEEVRLCDTVTVIFPEMGVNVKKKVVRVVYDVLREKYAEMELGDPRTSFSNLISNIVREDVNPVSEEALSAAISSVSAAITGNEGGNVVIVMRDGKPVEILIMDTDDIATARNVWRWNLAGLGHSSNGYNGSYDDLAILMDGSINASRILTGYMSADRIRAGVITAVTGDSTWNLNTGRFLNVGTNSQCEMSGGTIKGGSRSRDVAGYWLTPSTTILNGKQFYGGGVFTDDALLSFGHYVNGNEFVASMRIYNSATVEESDRGPGVIHFYNYSQFAATLYFTHTYGIYIRRALSTSGGNPVNLARLGSIVQYQNVNCVAFEATYDGNALLFRSAHPDEVGMTTALMVDNGIYHKGHVSVWHFLVVGSSHTSYNLSTYPNAKIHITGDGLISGTWRNVSDERLKTVKKWDGRYDELFDRVEVVQFEWKDDEQDDDTHIGVSAQQVKSIADELGIDGIVRGSERLEEGGYTVAYNDLLMLAVKRVKDLEARLEAAERKIEDLCKYISSQH